MLKVWGRRSAYNVQKVLWTIGELGLPYEHIDAGGSRGQLDTPEFLALNPHGRIPVLMDGKTSIWESNSIVRYLGAAYGAGSLWPEAPAPRSLADRWMDWELASLQPDYLSLFWGFFRTPVEQHDKHAIQHSLARCEKHFRKLDAHLDQQPYLAGTVLTMADIACASSLYRYFEMGAPVQWLPNVRAWYDRLSKRPAYREHIMVPFDELKGRLTF